MMEPDYKLRLTLGNDFGSVGRAVASDTKVPRFESWHQQNFYLPIEVCLRIYQVLISSVVLTFKLLAVEKKVLLFVTFQVRRCGSRFVRWNQISGCATRFQVSCSSFQELDSLQKTLDLPHLLRNAAAGEKSTLRKCLFNSGATPSWSLSQIDTSHTHHVKLPNQDDKSAV